MSTFIESSLYRTLSHIKSHDNFNVDIKDPSAHEIVDRWPLFLLMGTVMKLESVQIKEQECFKIDLKTSYDG